MGPVLFTIPRTVGWLAHWRESIVKEPIPLFRPKQLYKGEAVRKYVAVEDRKVEDDAKTPKFASDMASRRIVSVLRMSKEPGSTSSTFEIPQTVQDSKEALQPHSLDGYHIPKT